MSVWQLLVRRNLFRRRLRAILTIIGVSFGIAFMFGVYTTKDSVLRSANEMVDGLGGKTDLVLLQASGTGFGRDVVRDIERVPGVSLAVPSITRGVTLFHRGRIVPLELMGVDPKLDRRVRKYALETGRFFKVSDRRVAFINADFAADHGFRLGDTITVNGSGEKDPLKVIGLLENTGVGRVAQGNIMVTPLATAQGTFNLRGQISQVDVVAETNHDLGKLRKNLKTTVGSAYEVETTGKTVSALTDSIEFMTMAFQSLGYMVLVTGALLMLSTFRMNVHERQEEIAIMRSVGATRGQILRLVFMESVVYAAAGSVGGLILGWLLSEGMLKAVADYLQTGAVKAHWSPSAAAGSVAIGLAASLAASLWPAYKASRTWPAAAIQEAKREQPSRFLKYSWLIGSLLVLGSIAVFLKGPEQMDLIVLLFFVGSILMTPLAVGAGARLLAPVFRLVGAEGRIAGRNLARNQGRAMAAVTAILTSVLLVIWFDAYALSFRNAIDRFVAGQVGYDFNIGFTPFSLAGANRQPPLPYSWRKRIEKIDGVKGVQPLRFLPVKSTKQDLLALFMDPSPGSSPRRFELIDGGGSEALRRMARGGHAIVAKKTAEDFNLKRGDSIKLKTPEGWRNFKVAGIAALVGNRGDTLYLARRDLKALWNDTGIDYFNVTLGKGTAAAKVRRELMREIGRPAGWPIMSEAEYRASVQKIVDQFLAPLQSMVLLILLVSGFGILNIMAMNVVDRRREIGLFRAVGSLRRQVRQLVIYEAAALGFVGGAAGIAFGLPMSWMDILMVEEYVGMGFKYVFPTVGIATALFISMGLSLLAAALPAKQAAKTPIIDALRRE